MRVEFHSKLWHPTATYSRLMDVEDVDGVDFDDVEVGIEAEQHPDAARLEAELDRQKRKRAL